jgi:iron(III) transport system substrate-binding protein
MEGTFYSAAPMQARIDAEVNSGKPLADVVQVANEPFFNQLISKHELVNLKNVPNVAAIPAAYRDQFYAFAHEVFVTSITYNTNVLKSAPANYLDVVKLGKHAGIADPRLTGAASAITYLTMKLYGASFWTTVKDKGVGIFPSVTAMLPLAVSGELDAYIQTQGAGVCAEKQGEPVKVVYPAQGVIAIPQYTAVLAKASRPAAGELYASWVASPQGQQVITSNDCSFSARSGVQEPAGLPPLSSLNVLPFTSDELTKEYPAMQTAAVKAAGLSS